jgi:hypothetical protein
MATTYDPRNLEWDYYCRLMEEQFAPNQLGHVPEQNWRDWVDALNGIGYFVMSGIPDHRGFATWQEWAMQLVGIMSVDPQ